LTQSELSTNKKRSSEQKPKQSGLLDSGMIVSAMTMLSRVLGLIRDVVFARFIGADGAADAFYVAFKIPNFLRRLFAEGAFAQAFVPVLGEYRQHGGIAAVKELVDRISAALGSVLLLLTLLVVVASPVFTSVFAYGFRSDPEKFALTSDMLRITFPYLFFIAMTGMAGGVLNSFGRFVVPAFTPVLLNVCLIGAAVVGMPYFEQPVMALAWGVFVAGAAQMLFQIPFMMRLHLMPRPRWDWKHPGVKRILLLMGPAIFGVSVSQINLLLDTLIATWLPTGSVSWLYYSDRLSELPLGVFGVAIATVILPNLSRQHASKSPEKFAQTLDWALRFILIIAIPAAVALCILAEPILMTLFYYGEVMTLNDMAMATLSLRAYALGLTAFMLIKVLAPGFYARQDMKTPVRIGVIAMVTNMVLNIIFVVPLHHFWLIGHVGLALATAVSAFLNAILLFKGLRKQNIYQPQAGWLKFFTTLLVANVAMAITLFGFGEWLTDWIQWTWLQRSAWIALICGVGLAVYLCCLVLGGIRLRDLRGHGLKSI
jgi:putative peptidoglycan lipid II flippase